MEAGQSALRNRCDCITHLINIHQTLNCFEALKEAWGARKRELETRAEAFGGAGLFGGGNYGAMYGGQAQQLAQLEQVRIFLKLLF